MPKDVPSDCRLEDLTDEEVERIEGELFCMGGPPIALTRTLIWRASLTKAPPLKGKRRYAL